MRRLEIITCFILSGFCCKAQNWELIKTDAQYFYADTAGEMRAISVDSTLTNGDSTIYYNYKVLRQTEINPEFYSPDSPSWLGEKVIQINNDFYFINKDKDSLFIKTKSNLGTSWISKFANGNYVESKIMQVNDTTIFGLPDSIKIILLLLKDSTGNIIDPLKNLKVIISKNHGLVNFPDIYRYPYNLHTSYLVGKNNPDVGLTKLTASEIFDFDIGDEFHYYFRLSTNYFDSIKMVRKVLKEILPKSNQDSLFHLFEVTEVLWFGGWYMNADTNLTPTKVRKFERIESVNLKNNYLNFYPGEMVEDPSKLGFIINVSYNISSTYNDRQIIKINCHSSYQVPYRIDPKRYDWHVKGCGQVKYQYWQTRLGISNWLVYYKKGLDVWGQPFDFEKYLFIGPNQPPTYIVKVNSNLVSNEVNMIVDHPSENDFTLNLFDLCGKLVLNKTLTTGTNTIERNGLSSGLYIYQVLNENEKPVTGKIIFK